ncbi:MAG: Lrp/AsnC family transcriptional regulator [Thiothrix sp.]|nr:MAG: Lrp/AsnC family transcriptional regulator [Thiothrix sp.]
MDSLDRRIINELQDGFPISDHPYAEVAETLGTTETVLLQKLGQLLDEGLLSRFGPMYHAEQLGGALALCAMQVPMATFDLVADQVNSFQEVAHNYEREHRLNMWFVLATETPEELQDALDAIETKTGLQVYNMPKLEEFYVGLRFNV